MPSARNNAPEHIRLFVAEMREMDPSSLELPALTAGEIEKLASRLSRRLTAAVFLLFFFTCVPARAAVTAPQLDALQQQIIMAESSGRANVVGDGGRARGLMQIQKATWERYTSRPWSDAFNPAVNRQVGRRIMEDIAARYGRRATPALIVYTYNTGRFIKAGKSLPSWTWEKHPNRIYRSIFRAEARR